MAPSTKNFPIDQLEKKLKIYRLFENLFELTDYSLLDCFLNSLVEQINLETKNTEEFYTHLGENEKMQKKHFGKLNLIDGLFWLKVNKNIEPKEERYNTSQDGSVDKGFVFSTSQIIKLLKVSKSDLFALREANQLVEGTDYIREDRNSKAATRYAPILYNVFKTCRTLYGISYHDFCQPEFDLEEHKRRRTREIFKEANRRK